MDERDLEQIHALTGEVVRKSSRREGACLYRGEPECYPIVSSGLYRKCPDCADEAFDIDELEAEIVERARQYTTLDDRDEVLAEIQHFGGATNFLDFTDDYLIALFFACADRDGQDGRVVLHWPHPDAVVRPRHTNNRVVFQKSVFVRPRRGFLVPDTDEETVVVPGDLKGSVLAFLDRFHGICERSVYNDIHGYIKHQDPRRSRYAAEFRETLSRSSPDPGFDLAWLLSAEPYAIELVRMRHSFHQKGMDYSDGSRSAFAIHLGAEGMPDLFYLDLDAEAVIDLLTHFIDEKDGHVRLADAHCWRGAARLFLGSDDSALRDFENALELDAESAGAYHGRAGVYRQRGDIDRAMEDLERALDLKPRFPATLIDRGNLHRDQGTLEDATRDYDAAMARSRSGSEYTWYRDAHFYRGLARCIQRDWPGAVSDLESARSERLRVASSFRNIFGGVAEFEARYHLRLPSTVKTILHVA